MKGMIFVAAAVAVIGAARVSVGAVGEPPQPPLVPVASGHAAYRLHVAGAPATCMIRVGDTDEAGAALTIEPRCAEIFTGIKAAVLWREADDGTVSLAGGDGAVVAAFAPGDGHAYESFEPAFPVMSLVSTAD